MNKVSYLFDMTLIYAMVAMGMDVRNEAVTLEELHQKLYDLHSQATDIQNAADAEGRAMTEDEIDQVETILEEFETVQADVTRRQRIEDHAVNLNRGRGRRTAPNADPDEGGDDPSNSNPQNNGRQQPRPGRQFREPIDPVDRGQWGFRSFGEFAMAVKRGSGKGAEPDPRLIKNAPTTYGSEGVGADGGYAVPPDFRTEIKDLIFTDDSLIGRCDQMTTSANSMTVPVDENAAWDSTDGVQCYWEGEGSQLTQSKPNLKDRQIRTNKLTALVPMTEELMEDASGMDSYLRRKVPEKMDARINTALISGTGAGKPLGILNAPALVTVAKESGQTADTIVFENIVNMWTRMAAPYRRNAIWLINQDIEPQLMTMSFEGTSSSVPAYLPPGGLSASPYGMIMGRPVVPVQACQTLGDKGDIILADMSQYMALLKTGGLRTDVSMHLWFDYDVMAFRFIIRLAGQPWLSSPISPENGTNTLSPFVTLAARA